MHKVILFLIISLDDWKCDTFKWRDNGTKKLKSTPVLVKKYYVSIKENGEISNAFKRYSYTILHCKKGLVLIHYTGDNSTLGHTKPHIRTCPSVLRDLESSVKSPSNVYKDKILKCDLSIEHHTVLLLRNKKQVANMQAQQCQKLCLSHDALYNVHELAFATDVAKANCFCFIMFVFLIVFV